MHYAARDLHSHNPVGSLLQLRSALLNIQDPKPAESPADKTVIQIAVHRCQVVLELRTQIAPLEDPLVRFIFCRAGVPL